jgi:hypothetical protein
MKAVTLLPNGVYCITDGRTSIPDNCITFGSDSEYYDNEGDILPEYQKLPKFKPELLNKDPVNESS